MTAAAMALVACGAGQPIDDGAAGPTSVRLTIPEEAATLETTTSTTEAGIEVNVIPPEAEEQDDPASGESDAEQDSEPASGDQAEDTGDGDGSGEDEDPPPAWLAEEYQLLELAVVDQPTALTERSGGDDLWLTEREGRVRQIQRRVTLDGREQSFKLMNTVVLDITDKVSTTGEGGLLGLAFSLDGRLLYVSYTNRDGNSVVAEYRMDIITALPDTERILLEVEQPFSNHNGGQITTGPDGFLYVALGDGGSAGDPLDHGQNTQTFLGSILRIDPLGRDGDRAYGIPAGNPFSGDDGLPEIWVYGARNPWRFSFDRETSDLWVADVGQNRFEEINLLPTGARRAGRGANLGWREMEGVVPFEDGEAPADHTPPLFTYAHEGGRCSVTGGYVYRGRLIPALDGVYLFADYCTGEVFGLERVAEREIVVANLPTARPTGPIISFGEDNTGELLILEADGRVSLLRRFGAPPRTNVLDPDEAFPGGPIDDSVTPADPNDPIDPDAATEGDGGTAD